jgi:hypothetical protein
MPNAQLAEVELIAQVGLRSITAPPRLGFPDFLAAFEQFAADRGVPQVQDKPSRGSADTSASRS